MTKWCDIMCYGCIFQNLRYATINHVVQKKAEETRNSESFTHFWTGKSKIGNGSAAPGTKFILWILKRKACFLILVADSRNVYLLFFFCLASDAMRKINTQF